MSAGSCPSMWHSGFGRHVQAFVDMCVDMRAGMLVGRNMCKHVDKCVLLAMDKVHDKDGNPKDEQTHLYVPNSYIIKLSEDNERILFGASVHPYKVNWKDELDYCIANGACLCKWIPSSQQIDPTD